MPAVPGFKSHTLADVPYLISEDGLRAADDVLINSGQTSTLTPNYRMPPGMVVGKGSGSTWYQADHASVVKAAAAAITTSGHVDTLGAIVIVGNHANISVTTTTGTGTEAENATDLNADANFAAHYIATSGAGELTITSIATGADVEFYIDASTADGFGFAEGTANSVQGSGGDYRVTAFWADLQDLEGTAVNAFAPAHYAGHFREAELSNLTPEARAVLAARGSRFE